MATILDALKGINAYPIPDRTFVEIAVRRGVELDEYTTIEILESNTFNLARADVLLWLSYAPDISQGGQTYSFTDEQRLQMRNAAQRLLQEYADEDASEQTTIYGYKGSRL